MTQLPLPAAIRPRRHTASFGDLVNAHWEAREGDAEAREHYDSTRMRFEYEHGKIVDEYWSVREPAVVAITCLKTRWGREQWALHRNTARLAADRPDFGRLLREAARQSVRAANVLCGMTQRIATSNLFSLTRDIMASLEPTDTEPVGLDDYTSDLQSIEQYTGRAGARQAQIVYLKGLMHGLVVLAFLAPILAVVLSAFAIRGVDPGVFVGCLVAGSFGATMSVLMRMSSGNFDVNHEVGSEYVTNLGVARPYIGAIFALLLYFAFQGELTPQLQAPAGDSAQFAFFVASGFLIGFSERFAKEFVRNAESGTGAGQPTGGGQTALAPATVVPAAG